MRVIRTEMYFDEDEVSGYAPYRSRPPREGTEKNPGIAFVWFRQEMGGLPNIDNLKVFRALPVRSARSQDPKGLSNEVRGVLDLFIKDANEEDFFRIPGATKLENPNLVDFALAQDIILEHSPPFAVSFKALLDKKNSPLWIGTFVGAEMAWDHPVLLILTVPGGIIVVSSALGIGAAMQAGLNKAVTRLFDRNKR